MKTKKLPKRIYCKWTDEVEPFLETSDDPSLLAEDKMTIVVGEYELKAVRKLVNETRIE